MRITIPIIIQPDVDNFAISSHQHDLVKVPPPVGNFGRLALHVGLQPENIEMPDLLAEVFR